MGRLEQGGRRALGDVGNSQDSACPVASFVLETIMSAQDIKRQLTGKFRIQRLGRVVSELTYYDTFDWRLYRNAAGLVSAPSEGSYLLSLVDLEGTTRYRMTLNSVPQFARDLPLCQAREALEKVTELRRFLPIARIERHSERIAVLDRREKIVTRLSLDRDAVLGDSTAGRLKHLRLKVEPLTGYRKEYAAIVRFLEHEAGLVRCCGSEVERVLVTAGCCPLDYTGKLIVRLEPGIRTDTASKQILVQLLNAVEANERGLRDDLDPEFLHDFRVAVRRTRSYLGQVKGVFADDLERHFRGEFAWLGKLTGPTRDLDVHLLSIAGYEAEFPKTDFELMVRHLRRRRLVSRRRLLRGLDTRRYLKLKAHWNALIGTDVDERGPKAGLPISEIAEDRIARAYSRVYKRALGLRKETPSETIHRLRIDCKRLRYLLEFFRSLCDVQQANSVIRSLKGLQDRLGLYNDLSVQQVAVREMAEELFARSGTEASVFLSMGRLIERLEARQKLVKSQLEKSISGFTGEKTAEALLELVR
ncbi:MAG: hypothetical protein CL484_08690 [Acidobacteria bacterium]|nr:hypothetical protein [Acidobacteriota bacterium]